MKQVKALVVGLALVALLAGAVQAEMFVEGYIGGNWAANAPDEFTWGGYWRPSYQGHIDPAFQGGLKLGAWFDRTGVLSGINFPAWMRYFGFWLDFSYHTLNAPERVWTVGPLAPGPLSGTFWSEGAVATLAFMFGARYGFFPDAEVPFGRLQPYVAVGPALMFSWQQPTINTINGQWDADSSSSTNVGLAVEAGLRWMALKNVSLDVSFKYRYFNPTYKYSPTPWELWPDPDSYLRPNFHLFSLQVGAAYHF